MLAEVPRAPYHPTAAGEPDHQVCEALPRGWRRAGRGEECCILCGSQGDGALCTQSSGGSRTAKVAPRSLRGQTWAARSLRPAWRAHRFDARAAARPAPAGLRREEAAQKEGSHQVGLRLPAPPSPPPGCRPPLALVCVQGLLSNCAPPWISTRSALGAASIAYGGDEICLDILTGFSTRAK